MYRILISFILFTVVASAEDDPITTYIASLPWHGSSATSPEGKDNPDFIIIISYERKGVISDKDIIPFKLYPVRPSARWRVSSKSRESFGMKSKWCNGSANVSMVKQDGFIVDLNLTWYEVNVPSEDLIPTEIFKECFDCVWKTKQEFTTNGFHIVVETAKYNAEPTNAPYSSPATGLKR